MKLGKLPRRPLFRLPALAAYKRALALAPPPSSADWYSRISSWPMDANDRLGDCTCAAVAHCIQQWTTYASTPKILTDDQVIALYGATAGYVPGDDSTDNGAVEADVLSYWLKSGVAGDKLDGFVSLNAGDLDELRDAISWFGNAYIGLALPNSCRSQAIWNVPNGQALTGDWAPGSWGGHAVPMVGYDAGVFHVVTWGAIKTMTASFVQAYLDEAYALLNRDFITAGGKTPAGLDLDQLVADQAALKQ